jgi:redox-sensing transcriptional repressor
MKTSKISDAVVRRLPVYLRYLLDCWRNDILTVSSSDLGQHLDLNPAQIRKDFAYFGEFGRKGIGYDVNYLIEKIRQILKMDRDICVAIVGAGNLGKALCNYNAYVNEQMKVVAIFDNGADKVGQQVNNLTVQPMTQMENSVKQFQIRIGIITVPAYEAQAVANQLVACGVEAILNFAPIRIKVPTPIRVHHVDFTKDLHSLAFFLE